MMEWLTRDFGQLSYHMTQIMTGHGCFNDYLFRIGKAPAPGCSHCSSLEDSAQHTLEVCPAWEVERETLISWIGADLRISTVVERILQNSENWRAFSYFCTSVMRKKEVAERKRQRLGAAAVPTSANSSDMDSDPDFIITDEEVRENLPTP